MCSRPYLADLPSISIVVKTLNEEAKIGRCIESVLAALKEIPNRSEVIIADSVSRDHTTEVAQRYPVTIVQFADQSERGCGAGVQLGYQHSQGDFVLLLDGDMQLLPGFLSQALARFAAEPRLAGVAGLVEETSVVNAFDRARISSGASNTPLVSAKWLNGGGLYRRTAIEATGGYAADRNLKSWEEAELGMRLTSAGWTLERIAFRSTLHTGHAASTWDRLRSSWVSRRAMASGVLLKQCFGKPWMSKAFVFMLPPLTVITMWVVAIPMLAFALLSKRWDIILGVGLVAFAMLIALVVYKRGPVKALVTLGMLHYMAASILLGLREPVKDPKERIESVNLSSQVSDRMTLASHCSQRALVHPVVDAQSMTFNSL